MSAIPAAATSRAGTLRFDVVAGLIAAAVVIPKSMAYARKRFQNGAGCSSTLIPS